MGRGSSKGSGGGTAGAAKATTPAPAPQVAQQAAPPPPPPAPAITDFAEAFGAGKNFEKSGDVNHSTRTVSSSLQRQWDGYTDQFGIRPTTQEEKKIFKEWDNRTGQLYGYVRTSNSFAINKALYDPNNAGKTDAQIFTRKDRQGKLRDLETVRTMDKLIGSHKTPTDASYSRFGSANSIQATFGLSDAQMKLLSGAKNMTPAQLNQLNASLRGTSSYSAAYTSTSANRSMNAFKDPRTRQAQGFNFERKISVPKGTNAFAVRNNTQESEIIFGRKMKTKLTGVSISKDGHIVIHEMFDGYK